MPSDFLKRHTVSARWWENPPKRRRKAKAARRSAPKRRASRGKARGQVVHATKLGQALELRYIHAGNQKAHKHKFGRGTSVAYTADRRYLVIGPVNINPYIEG